MQSPLFSRRHWLAQAGLGFGSWALLDLLEREARAAGAADEPAGPEAARTSPPRRSRSSS